MAIDHRFIHDLQLRNRKNIMVYPGTTLLVVLLGLADYYSGYDVSFLIFYLLPVTIAVYFSNMRFGLFISLLCSVISYYADVYAGHPYSSSVIPIWNAAMRFGYYCLHMYLLNYILQLYEKAHKDSLIDSLTGAVNTRYFNLLFDRELSKAERSKNQLTLAFLDLDNFKAVNDTFGHAAGDDLLQRISGMFIESIRPSDIFARMGGDEFIVLISETDFPSSEKILNRMKKVIDSECARKGWPVTMSVGAITFSGVGKSREALVQRADQLMYQVKKDGKNRVLHIAV